MSDVIQSSFVAVLSDDNTILVTLVVLDAGQYFLVNFFIHYFDFSLDYFQLNIGLPLTAFTFDFCDVYALDEDWHIRLH